MARENKSIHLSVPNTIESLNKVSTFLDIRMKDLGIRAEKIAEIQIAVDEAFTNMIQHSTSKISKENIEIQCNRSNGHFKVEIKNYGNPFNPITAEIKPDVTSKLEDRSVGGLGIHFIRNLVDDLKYEYSEMDGFEILTMIKYV